jgi:hypothetical protein
MFLCLALVDVVTARRFLVPMVYLLLRGQEAIEGK